MEIRKAKALDTAPPRVQVQQSKKILLPILPKQKNSHQLYMQIHRLIEDSDLTLFVIVQRII
jgi:hypothetical protein